MPKDLILGHQVVVELAGQEFLVRELLRPSTSAVILQALGGDLAGVSVEPEILVTFLSRHGDRRRHFLTFFRRNMIHVCWDNGTWNSDRHLLQDQSLWRAGHRVLCPKLAPKLVASVVSS